MTYPAENVLTFVPLVCQYLNSSGNIANFGVTCNISKKHNIHDACGKATMIKGFKLCRNWNRTYGSYKLVCDGGGGSRRSITGGVTTFDYRPLSGLHAWGSSGQVYINLFGVPPLAGSNMINATLVKALNKLKSQDVHIGNFVAESHKTFEMVGNTASRIARSVSAFRAKRPKEWGKVVATQTGNLARKDWHTVPNSWLELQYGWKPLMDDVYGAIHHLSRRSRYEFPYSRVSGYSFTETEVKSNVTLSGGSCFDLGGLTQDVYMLDKQEVFITLIYGLTSPILAEISSLGLLSPLEIVWETTRYSFVVDWFLPIGPWLSALTADAGYTFITGNQSRKTTRKFLKSVRTGTWPATFVPFPGTTRVYSYPANLEIDSDVGTFSRSCYASSPFPGLYVKNPLSFAHVANGLSLLAQAFKH